MAIPWMKKIREGGELSVFNKAKLWEDAVNTAIDAFNRLSFGVKLVTSKDEKSANIVLVLANGHSDYTYRGTTVDTGGDFRPDRLHGKTRALYEVPPKEIFFAVTFLPGKVKGTKKQREVIVVHEFIHACGMEEHDKGGGIMNDYWQESGDGLLELLPDKGAKPLPPIRVGGQTSCIMQMLWAGGAACKAS